MSDDATKPATEGRLNRYTCEKCGGFAVTLDVDAGATPFMIGCRAQKNCDGTMTSAFYRIEGTLDHEWEWYRPDVAEARRLTDPMLDHVIRGGLLLRKRQKAVIHG